MGKIRDALKKAAQERLARIEKLDKRADVKYEFIAKKTVDSKIDPRIVSFYNPKSSVAEQYRTLRTNLQALNTKHPVKVITITSSIHNEGKTITAINLAISMAHDLNKKQILLVDGDLRRASISRYLGINSETGLADLISNGTNIDETLLNIGIENLTILPAGKIPQNPAELLASSKMGNLISALRSKYDYVIFDAPPITQRGVVKHGEDLLKQAQAKMLGYILTNIQYHIPAYIYRYL